MAAQPEVVEAPPARRRWAALGRTEGPARRAVARAPASVRTKLLVAFLVIAALLVARERARAARARPGERARRAARRAAAPLVAVPGARGDRRRPPADARRARGRARATLTPYTGGKTLQGGRAWAARRPRDRAMSLSQVEVADDERGDFGFVPPPADERVLRRIRADYRTVSRARDADPASSTASGVAGLQGGAPYVHDGDARRRRPVRARARTSPTGRAPRRRRSSRRTAAPTRRRATSSSRVSAASVAARARARARPLLVADRPDPADRGAPRRDRRRRLLRAARRAEPGRARLARRERQPHERRAAAALRRARDREPAQERVPREHVARAADAAERDHRLLAGAAAAALRRGQREAGGVPRRHPLVGQPPALADQRRARPVEGRGRAGRARDRATSRCARHSSAAS